MLCQTHITHQAKKNLSMANAECVWLQVLPDHQQPFLVGCLYRPPIGSLHKFHSEMAGHLESLTDGAEDQPYHILGDFNIDINSDKGERLRQCASDLGYKQWISEPTRSTATSSTTIDLIFAP